jgi:hypothetical protein
MSLPVPVQVTARGLAASGAWHGPPLSRR